MRTRFIRLICSFSLCFTACEETIVLDLSEQSAPKIVIEGMITNESKRHFVKVTQSRGFYDTGKPTPITNAMVTVETEGEAINFVHNPGNHPDSLEYYLSEDVFEGEAGRTYNLSVVVGTETFKATDTLPTLSPIDSLSFGIDEDEAADPEKEGFIYEVYFYMKEPQATKDYYLFKFYRNETEVFDSYENVYVFNDELLKETIDGVSAASFYQLYDTVLVRSFSLSQKVYLFYSDVSAAVNNDGGIFGPPPSNPRTNITGGALGIFQTSYISEKSIIIK